MIFHISVFVLEEEEHLTELYSLFLEAKKRGSLQFWAGGLALKLCRRCVICVDVSSSLHVGCWLMSNNVTRIHMLITKGSGCVFPLPHLLHCLFSILNRPCNNRFESSSHQSHCENIGKSSQKQM